jgi:hypothetical protein
VSRSAFNPHEPYTVPHIHTVVRPACIAGAIAGHINDCCTLQPVDSAVEALSVGIERLIIAAEYFRMVRIAAVSVYGFAFVVVSQCFFFPVNLAAMHP